MEVNNLIGLKRQVKKQGWRKDWTPADEDALLRGCWFDESAGHAPIEFIEALCVQSQGRWAGQPLELIEWQKEDVLIPLYGWMREDGTRRYRQLYCCVAKKNGKSTLCSALELYGLLGDGEPGAEIYTAATTKDQAGIVHKETANMVRASPALSKRLKISDHTKTITFGTTAWIRALPADAASTEGLKTYYLVIDEFHAWSDLAFYNSLRWGMAARDQPLTLIITTAGDTVDSICGQRDQYCRKILDGELFNYALLPVIYSADLKDDVEHPETWEKSNPSLGITINRQDFGDNLQEAKDSGLADLAAFKRYRLNMWVDASDPYFPTHHWEQVANQVTPELDGAQCFGGLDLSSKEDITSLAWCFPVFTDETTIYHIITRHWVPEENAKGKAKKGESNYINWIESGDLLSIPGEIIDQDIIFEQIRLDFERFDVREIAFDRWNSDQLAKELDIMGLEVIPFGQGYASFSFPTKEIKNLMVRHELSHDGNQCMSWMMGNVVVAEDPAGNVKPIKKSVSGKQKRRYKIDGPVAAIMALDRALRFVESRSSWETSADPLAD